MKFHIVWRKSSPESASPYRLVCDQDQEVGWANDFLDAQRMRGLSLCSLRAYAYDLLHLAHWFSGTSARLSKLNQSTLLDYVRFQLDHKPKPAAQTINHRLSVLYCLYRFYHGREIPLRPSSSGRSYTRASPFGYGRTSRVVRGLRVQIPRRVVIPLSVEEVSQFWNSFRTFRDLSIVALMLFSGLRSREVLHLQLEDLRFAQAEVRVQGKGNRERLLPLPEETIDVLHHYLRIERPLTNSSSVFLSLKGLHRGRPLTTAGLRSLFRHHRRKTGIVKANPHRFRHTFGADMVRAGISLPALMRLMGHGHIHTTMLYVQLSPQDVWREFQRATQNRGRLPLPEQV